MLGSIQHFQHAACPQHPQCTYLILVGNNSIGKRPIFTRLIVPMVSWASVSWHLRWNTTAGSFTWKVHVCPCGNTCTFFTGSSVELLLTPEPHHRTHKTGGGATAACAIGGVGTRIPALQFTCVTTISLSQLRQDSTAVHVKICHIGCPLSRLQTAMHHCSPLQTDSLFPASITAHDVAGESWR